MLIAPSATPAMAELMVKIRSSNTDFSREPSGMLEVTRSGGGAKTGLADLGGLVVAGLLGLATAATELSALLLVGLLCGPLVQESLHEATHGSTDAVQLHRPVSCELKRLGLRICADGQRQVESLQH